MLGASLVGIPSSSVGGAAVEQEELASQVWYGLIMAPEGDRALIRSLGVELGEYISLGDGRFPARVDAKAMQELRAFSELYDLQLTLFDEGLLHPKTGRLAEPLPQATPAMLEGYRAYLRYVVANQVGRSWAEIELADVNRELRQRELDLPGRRDRPKPGTLEPEP